MISIDTEENKVYTGQTKEHFGLNKYALKLKKESINWINRKFIQEKKDYLIRIRYRQKLQKGVLIYKNDEWYILFEQKQSAISPGQFAAWYLGGVLIGSGVIEH